jgi:hypothetical protein
VADVGEDKSLIDGDVGGVLVGGVGGALVGVSLSHDMCLSVLFYGSTSSSPYSSFPSCPRPYHYH